MAKFNTRDKRHGSRGFIQSEQEPTGVTYEGAPGYARDTKSELFQLAVTNFSGEDTFYEDAQSRDSRFVDLVHKAAVEDPEWTVQLISWLRHDAYIRTASIVAAAEFVRARHVAGIDRQVEQAPGEWGYNRRAIRAALSRGDEPGEMLAYWTSEYGRPYPRALLRGIAHATKKLYHEYSFHKWDSNEAAWRFGDVIDLTKPKPRADGSHQSSLFKYAIDKRHNRPGEIPEDLVVSKARHALMSLPVEQRRQAFNDDPEILEHVGITWEALSGWLQGPMDKGAWEAIIPNMGYMALLRNLRNFDQAGVSLDVKHRVAQILSCPDNVMSSRQFPFRFLSAYKNAPNDFWGPVLDEALQYSLSNIPDLPGKSLILIDTSGSMDGTISAKSSMTRAEVAAVFGIALASKGEDVQVYGFANHAFHHPLVKGANVLREIKRFTDRIGEAGHGTDFATAVRQTYSPSFNRVFLISDMQTMDTSFYGQVPWHEMIDPKSYVYAFNLAGYKHVAGPISKRMFEFGGLTDATFKSIPLLETSGHAKWPWLQ